MMYVLKANDLERMLVSNGREIFLEVFESEVPEKFKIDRLGGCGVQKEDYYRSNTGNITYGRYFKRISCKTPECEPLLISEFEKINDDLDIEKFIDILEKTDINSVYRIHFEKAINFNEGTSNNVENYILRVNRKLEDEELKAKDGEEFGEFAYNFFENYSFRIKAILGTEKGISKEEAIEEISTLRNRFYSKNDDTALRHSANCNLEELKKIILKFDLKLLEKYYSSDVEFNPCCRKCRHSRNIDVNNRIRGILTLNEASKKYNISEGNIRYAIQKNKLIEGTDYKKSGRITLVNEESIRKMFYDKK